MPDARDLDGLIDELITQENNLRFDRLLKVCTELFGGHRRSGSHHIFRTPWPGDPRINLQKTGRVAKPYQVRQVVRAIRKFKVEK